MVYCPGAYEEMDPDDEKALREYLGEPDIPPPTQFMRLFCDDVLIVSATKEEHIRQWRTIIWWFAKYRIHLAADKTKVCCESLDYLGYVCGFGIQYACPDRTQSIALMPEDAKCRWHFAPLGRRAACHTK